MGPSSHPASLPVCQNGFLSSKNLTIFAALSDGETIMTATVSFSASLPRMTTTLNTVLNAAPVSGPPASPLCNAPFKKGANTVLYHSSAPTVPVLWNAMVAWKKKLGGGVSFCVGKTFWKTPVRA